MKKEKKKKDDIEVDYKAMYENAAATFFDTQREYFELLQYVTENSGKVSALTDNLFKMNLFDQVLYLRSIKKNLEVVDYLIKKYGFEAKEKEDDQT